jgi:hypothetical protein
MINSGGTTVFKYSEGSELYRLIKELEESARTRGFTVSPGLESAFRTAASSTGTLPAAEGEEDAPRAMVSAVRQKCEVDTAWIDTVEAALPHLEKAIEQARSLIKKDGEVVRIDRAKKFSRESVSHLSRHSNMIKRVDEGGKVLPEEIYVTENDEDFGIYENRFLYLTLTELRAFVALRYSQIKKAASGSGIRISIHVKGGSGGGKADYLSEISESSVEGTGAVDSELEAVMGRLDDIAAAVDGFLANQLMVRVADAPRLIPPVVRTNVIKNNVDFQKAFELYTFISSDPGQGYRVTKEESGTVVLTGAELGTMRELAVLQLFTGYQSAFRSWDEIKEQFRLEDNERIIAELDSRRAAVERMKAALSVAAAGKDDYMRLLEEQNVSLSGELEAAAEERLGLLGDRQEAQKNNERLKAENEGLKEDLRRVESDALARIDRETARIGKEYEDRLDSERALHAAEIDRINAEYKEKIDLLSARLRAAGIAAGEDGAAPEVDNREDFIRLEAEKKAFDGYFEGQWKKNKKRIKKEIYSQRRKAKKEGAPEASGTDEKAGDGI